MKKRIAILICLFSITIPVVPVWGRESSELNLTAGATKQIDDILLNDISDFKDAESLANRIVYNNFDENIDDVVNSVLFHYRKAYK